jgi:hypothetical protein
MDVALAVLHSQFLAVPKIGSPPKTSELQAIVVPRVDTDANAGRAGTRAKNLAQVVLEFRKQLVLL